MAILCDLFGMVKWPLQRLSHRDLQRGDKKTSLLNHLDGMIFTKMSFLSFILLLHRFSEIKNKTHILPEESHHRNVGRPLDGCFLGEKLKLMVQWTNKPQRTWEFPGLDPLVSKIPNVSGRILAPHDGSKRIRPELHMSWWSKTLVPLTDRVGNHSIDGSPELHGFTQWEWSESCTYWAIGWSSNFGLPFQSVSNSWIWAGSRTHTPIFFTGIAKTDSMSFWCFFVGIIQDL